MPRFSKRGASYRIHPRIADPDGQHARSLNGHLQRVMDSLPPPSKVTTFAEMSPEKQAMLRKLYERKP